MPTNRKQASTRSKKRSKKHLKNRYTRKSLINGMTIEKNSLFKAETKEFVNNFFEENGLIDISETNVGGFIEWEDNPVNLGLKITPKFPPVENEKLAIYWEYVESVFQKIRNGEMEFEDAKMFGCEEFGRDYTVEEDHEVMCLFAGIDELEGRYLGSTQPYRDFNETFKIEINKINSKRIEKCQLDELENDGIIRKEISEMAKENLKNVRKNERVIRRLCANFLTKFHEKNGSKFEPVRRGYSEGDYEILKEAIPAFGLTRKEVEKIYLESFENQDGFETVSESGDQSVASSSVASSSALESLLSESPTLESPLEQMSIFSNLESPSNNQISINNESPIEEKSTPLSTMTHSSEKQNSNTGEKERQNSRISSRSTRISQNSQMVTFQDELMTQNSEMVTVDTTQNSEVETFSMIRYTDQESNVADSFESTQESSPIGEDLTGEKESDDIFGDLSTSDSDEDQDDSEVSDFENLKFDISYDDTMDRATLESLIIDNLDIDK